MRTDDLRPSDNVEDECEANASRSGCAAGHSPGGTAPLTNIENAIP